MISIFTRTYPFKSSLLFATCFLALQASYGQLKPIYPVNANLLDVQVVSSEKAFIVGEGFHQGVIYKTTNAGKSWLPVTVPDSMNGQYSIYASASFIDADTGYVLDKGEHKVLKTKNGGQSWSSVRVNIDENLEQIKFTSASTGYIRSASGRLFKTTNYGASWTQLSRPDSGGFTPSAAFVSDQVIYTVYNSKFYRSVNGGASWSGPLTVDFMYTIYSIYFINADVGFARGAHDLFQTWDGGLTWYGAGNFWGVIEYYFDEWEGIYLDNYSRIYYTPDHGFSYTNPFTTDYFILWSAVDFNNSFGCAIGKNGAIITTHDRGQTWTPVNIVPDDDFRDIAFPTDSTALAIGDFVGTYRTKDGGTSWYPDEHSFDREDKYMLSFTPSGKDTALLEIVNNYSYITYDKGASFTPVPGWDPPFIGYLSARDYFLFNSKDIFAVGVKGGTDIPVIAHSVTGGTSWQRQNMPFTNQLLDITFPTWHTGYVCGQGGKIMKTSDHGANWTDRLVAPGYTLTRMFFFDSAKGYIGGWQKTLLQTKDGGANWKDVNSGLEFPVAGLHFINDAVGYCISRAGEISRTKDSGNTWTKISEGDPQWDISKVVFKNDSILFAIGRRTIYSANLKLLPLQPPVTPGNSPKLKFKIYPNPANREITIETEQPVDIERIFIYDITGKLVLSHRYNGGPSTIYNENISALAGGAYVLVVTGKDFELSAQKFIKAAY